MDIAAMATQYKQIMLQSAVQVKVQAMTMDMATEQSAELIKAMEQSVNPHIGGNLDISV